MKKQFIFKTRHSVSFNAAMKARRCILSASIASAMITVLCHRASAVSYTWDGGDTVTTGAQGGAGTWDTNSTVNWWNGTSDVVWPLSSSGADAAVFSGTSGAVNISGGVTVNSLTFSTTGYTIAGGTLTLDGSSPTITVGTGIGSTIGSGIGGASGLTKAGSGTLTLSGSLLYSGTTIVNAGTLSLSGASAYTGPTVINAGGTLAVGYVGNLTLSGSVTGAGNLTKLTTGTLTLNAAPVLTGTMAVSTGIIFVPSLLGISSISIDNGGTFNVTGGTWGGNTVTFGASGGTLQVNNANFYYVGGGATNIVTTAGGASSQFLGSSMINLNNGTMNFNIGGDLNVTDPIRNGGTVNKSGTGTLIVSGNASNEGYSLFLNAGTVRADNANALGNGSGAITFQGGTLQYNIASPTDWSSRIRNSTGAISVDTNGQSIAWSGALANTNTGGLIKSGSGMLTLVASNSFSGGVTVTGGTLVAGNASALGATTGALSINGGVLNLSGFSISVGTLSGSSGATITTSTAAGTTTLTTSIGLGASTYAGVIADNGSGLVALVKNGAGTLTLSGSNSYSGGTIVNAGALAVSSTAALPGWSTAGQLTVISGAGLWVGNAFPDVGIATLLATGSNFRAGSVIGFDTSAGDRTFAASLTDTAQGALGMVKTGSNTLTLSGLNSYSGSTTVSGGTLTFANLSGSNAIGAMTVLGGTAGATLNMNGATSLGSNSLTVGNASGDRSVVNVAGNLNLSGLGIGSAAGSAGALYLTSGTVTRTAGSEGFANSGYGYLKISGGTLTGSPIWQGQGNGVITQSGGTFTQNTGQPFVLGGVNTAGGTGVFNLNGGTMSLTGNSMGVGWGRAQPGAGSSISTAVRRRCRSFISRGRPPAC